MDLEGQFVAKHFTNEELLRMVTYLEAELEAKECYIAIIKNERVKNILHNVRYGKMPKIDDPLEALKRDSDMVEEKFDEDNIKAFYERQFNGIESLIKSQKKYHNNCKKSLTTAENRSAEIIKNLELQQKEKDNLLKYNEDIRYTLEKEKNELHSSLLSMTLQVNDLKCKLERKDRLMDSEKERTKLMILFLMEERKKIILSNHELELKCKSLETKLTSSLPIDEAIIAESEKEIKNLREEKSRLLKNLEEMKEKISVMEMIIKNQEDDLNLIRKNILAKTKNDSMLSQIGAFPNNQLKLMLKNVENANGIRIPNSNTFPSTSKESSIPVFNSKLPNPLPSSRLTFTSERRYPRTVPTLPSRPPVRGIQTIKKISSPINNVSNMAIVSTGINKLHLNDHTDSPSSQMKIQSPHSRISRVPTMSSNKRSTSLPRTTLQVHNQSLKTLHLLPKIVKNDESLSSKKTPKNNRLQNVSPCHNNNSPSRNESFHQQIL
uniref:CortBP2 domain-containing protein n=1 Tax=Strongyloides venezuelensis TaxID=75913 RepID=A0A0K0FBV9_STRVS